MEVWYQYSVYYGDVVECWCSVNLHEPINLYFAMLISKVPRGTKGWGEHLGVAGNFGIRHECVAVWKVKDRFSFVFDVHYSRN